MVNYRSLALPCGKRVEVEDISSIPDHLAIENICMDGCQFYASCGRFYDWFVKNHSDMKPM